MRQITALIGLALVLLPLAASGQSMAKAKHANCPAQDPEVYLPLRGDLYYLPAAVENNPDPRFGTYGRFMCRSEADRLGKKPAPGVIRKYGPSTAAVTSKAAVSPSPSPTPT